MSASSHSPIGPSPIRRRLAVLAVVVPVVGLAALGSEPMGAQVSPTSVLQPAAPTSSAPTTVLGDGGIGTRPGRIAYVTLAGDVVVAASDGSSPVTIGTSAATNAAGLAPLAWSPVGSQIAYVRTDGALVLADVKAAAPPQIVATDAVVPPDASEDLLSFDVTGVSISYLAAGLNGVAQAKLALYDGAQKGEFIALSDPATRRPLAIQYSPLDPYLLLRSADVETGKEFSVAVVEPFSGTPFATPFSVDDPVFAPDGAFVYGVVAAKGREQLARIDAGTAKVAVLGEHDRVCRPMPSPDGKLIVFAAGASCQEVWVMDFDGANERMVLDSVGGSSSFVDGIFSWALDGSQVSHAACRELEAGAACGGAYWDIPLNGSSPKARAVAGSVRREQRSLVKALKVKVELTGPIQYSERLLVAVKESSGRLLERRRDSTIDVSGVDERDPQRIFTIQAVVAKDSRWISGTFRVQDPSGFDQKVTFFGSVLVQSYRFAAVRGVWVSTTAMPLRSGRFDVVIYR